MNDFSEYEKMPKNFKKIDQDTSLLKDLNKLKWVVTEKVHGASFSFIYKDKTLKFAKRKDFLKWSDSFFAFQLVVNKLESQILQLFEQLSRDISAEKYILYGELCGGKYPHPEVSPVEYVQAIQTGVYYSPHIEFYAFDLAIEPGNNASKYYIDYEKALSYFQTHGLTHAKVLLSGKLNEVLEFNTRINSGIPSQLGLPELENNLIEGVVIKPLSHLNVIGQLERPIIKIKNPEFDEEEKFHQSESWLFTLDVLSKSEELGFLLEEIRRYITKNRLNSVLSKTGSLDLENKERMQEIEKEFLRDVITDFNEDNNHILNDINTEQRVWIEERIKADIGNLIAAQ